MSETTYRVTTLGCRVNRADSLAIEKQLAELGYRRAVRGDVPDLWIVNTCAVTAEGMKKSRKAVRRCVASGARVIVTGCGVDMEPAAFEADGVDSLFPNDGKEDMVIASCGPTGEAAPVRWAPEDLVRVPVKVQEGCSRYCAYCIVPFLRPGPSSRGIADVVDEVAGLSAIAGEAILCGIDLGSYRDPGTDNGLDALVLAASGAAGDMWLRLSSIELSDVKDALLEAMRSGALCKYLHVPLQSGDAAVLKAMRREYSPSEFRQRIFQIRESVPGINISSDVMVGFPGEDEAAFENTAAMVEELGFSRVHVFKYSRRRGSRAYDLGDPVPGGVKNRRASELRALAEAGAYRFHAGLVGRIIPVLVEGTIQSEPGRLFGRAQSFAGVVFEGGADLIGERVDVRVISSGSRWARGTIEETGQKGG